MSVIKTSLLSVSDEKIIERIESISRNELDVSLVGSSFWGQIFPRHIQAVARKYGGGFIFPALTEVARANAMAKTLGIIRESSVAAFDELTSDGRLYQASQLSVFFYESYVTSEQTIGYMDELGMDSSYNASINHKDLLKIKALHNEKIGRKKPKLEPTVLAISSLKGGSSKSVMTVGLAGSFALASQHNYRVLVIDADYQYTSSQALLPVTGSSGTPTLLDLMVAGRALYYPDTSFDDERSFESFQDYSDKENCVVDNEEDFINLCKMACIDSTIGNVKVIRNESATAIFDRNFKPKDHGMGLMRKIVDAVKDEFDIILMDVRPDLQASTTISLFAADGVLCPMRPTDHDRASMVNYWKSLGSVIIPDMMKEGFRGWDYRSLIFTQVSSGQLRKAEVSIMESISESMVNQVSREKLTSLAVINSASGYTRNIWSLPFRPSATGIKTADVMDAMQEFKKISNEIEANLILK